MMLRVVWLPGSDRLSAVCHCGAEQVCESPVETWEWLLAHPVGHEPRLPDPLPEPAVAGASA